MIRSRRESLGNGTGVESFRNPAMMAQSPKAAATLASKAVPLTLSNALPPSSEERLAPKREAISVQCGACERSAADRSGQLVRSRSTRPGRETKPGKFQLQRDGAILGDQL